MVVTFCFLAGVSKIGMVTKIWKTGLILLGLLVIWNAYQLRVIMKEIIVPSTIFAATGTQEKQVKETFVISVNVNNTVKNAITTKAIETERREKPTEEPNIIEYMQSDNNMMPLRPRQRFLKQPNEIFTKPCESRCHQVPQWKMVIFVKSKSDHFKARETIRRTWGSLRYINNAVFHTVFVCGKEDGEHSAILAEEHRRYGDILQYDGDDGYKNITLKTLAGMQWSADHLHGKFDYYATSDDDIVVNMGALQRQIDEAQKKMAEFEWSEFPLVCLYKKMTGEKPHRRNESKWFIPKELHPWHSWPDCCYGGFYATSVRVITNLYHESRQVVLLHLDDVWITGVLRQRAGMPADMVLPQGSANDVYHVTNSDNWAHYWSQAKKALGTEDICSC